MQSIRNNGIKLSILSFFGIEPKNITTKDFVEKFSTKYIMIMYPVQFPLHEPYFDLTPIKVIHTKIMH